MEIAELSSSIDPDEAAIYRPPDEVFYFSFNFLFLCF